MKLVYFAWVRERIGRNDELRELPANVVTVADLVAWLVTLDEGYALAFANPAIIRCAIDKLHATPETRLAGAREIAFFPPMTGG
ncbi:MAG: MoaD/ThiS family protein [Bosea sp. (in: a-proteobacteria)]